MQCGGMAAETAWCFASTSPSCHVGRCHLTTPSDCLTDSVFHGGGFFLGTSSMIPFNSVRYLLSKGIAVASFEYRFAPQSVFLASLRLETWLTSQRFSP